VQDDCEEVGRSASTDHCDPLPRLDADPDQLGVVLHQLIANALKFRGEAAAHIHLSATREADGWRLSVADNGIGVDPAHRERIFRMFHRAHSQGDRIGSGVGLAICRRIVQRHGGRLWVEPRPEGGAAFHLTIPNRQPAGTRPAAARHRRCPTLARSVGRPTTVSPTRRSARTMATNPSKSNQPPGRRRAIRVAHVRCPPDQGGRVAVLRRCLVLTGAVIQSTEAKSQRCSRQRRNADPGALLSMAIEISPGMVVRSPR
jgi:hypothetical protein